MRFRDSVSSELGSVASRYSPKRPLHVAAQIVLIAVWGALFVSCGEFVDFPTAFYHSTVNFATLGYGDIIMSPRWRLLGALEGGRWNAHVRRLGRSSSFAYRELGLHRASLRAGAFVPKDAPRPSLPMRRQLAPKYRHASEIESSATRRRP